jgi:hypothetical protein
MIEEIKYFFSKLKHSQNINKREMFLFFINFMNTIFQLIVENEIYGKNKFNLHINIKKIVFIEIKYINYNIDENSICIK